MALIWWFNTAARRLVSTVIVEAEKRPTFQCKRHHVDDNRCPM